jgi:hypothetical protein
MPATAPRNAPIKRGSKEKSCHPMRAPAISAPSSANEAVRRKERTVIVIFATPFDGVVMQHFSTPDFYEQIVENQYGRFVEAAVLF